MTDEERKDQAAAGGTGGEAAPAGQAGAGGGGAARGGDDEARRAAIEKAKALAAAKAAAAAKARAAAGEGGGAAAGGEGGGDGGDAGPVMPERYQQFLDALGKEFEGVDFAPAYNAADGFLYINVPRDRLREIALYLRDRAGLNYLRALSGVDWMDRLQVVYHLTRVEPDTRPELLVAMQVDVDRDQAVCPSLVDVWPTADFNEREVFDLFGIRFEGHPNLRRILLPDNWQGGYPLRKDFVDKRPKRQRKIRPR
ncbi:MAG: hypothetical protein DIU84_07060 [Bacillota bacterium]|nr:MAG: hypothetical protein DIU84_07060 [Bacillota bacterium]